MIGRREFVQGAGLLALQTLSPGGASAAEPAPAPERAAPPPGQGYRFWPRRLRRKASSHAAAFIFRRIEIGSG